MNLYSSKQRWKIVLLLTAILIVAASLWYSSVIVDQIRTEEREKVKVWSAAIKEKASLISYTDSLFQVIREAEQIRVNQWAMANAIVTSDVSWPDYTLISDIISNNTTIPLILVNNDGDYSFRSAELNAQRDSLQARLTRLNPNTPDSILLARRDSIFKDTLEAYTKIWGAKNPPIEDEQYGVKVSIYYTESTVFKDLKQRRDSLLNAFTDAVVENTVSVPVLFTNEAHDSIIASSIYYGHNADTLLNVKTLVDSLGWANEPIEIAWHDKSRNYIYFEESEVLQQLRFYPYVQFSIIGLFLFIAYLLFSTFRRSEQNQVWVGMAKETAHQLGTPLSSLMAWMQLLEAKGVDKETLAELNKDVARLETITDRFSKIGSEAELQRQSVEALVTGVVDYLRSRVSKKVRIDVNADSPNIEAQLNEPLFEWVIENLVKNAIDAMKGNGEITIAISQQSRMVLIDISDTGAGIPPSKFKTVFQPGYTTKKRGWGLGLTLVKRIVESYHSGRIFVKNSEIGKGTTFRIMVKR